MLPEGSWSLPEIEEILTKSYYKMYTRRGAQNQKKRHGPLAINALKQFGQTPLASAHHTVRTRDGTWRERQTRPCHRSLTLANSY